MLPNNRQRVHKLIHTPQTFDPADIPYFEDMVDDVDSDDYPEYEIEQED